MLGLNYVLSATVRRLSELRLTAIVIPAILGGAIGTVAQQLPAPINLSSAVGGGSNPVMTLDVNGNIDVAYVGAGVYFARSTDRGAAFSTTTVQPLSLPPLGVQMGVDMAGHIELLWPTSPDDTHPGGSAFYSRSTDSGATFSTAVQFTPPTGVTSSAIQLVVEPAGAIDIVWLDQIRANLFYARSTDGGVTFSTPAQIWSVTGDLADLHVAPGSPGTNGQLYVFWTHIVDEVQCDVLFSRTLDGGATFSPLANLSATDGACSASPKPFVDPGGGVNVAWLVNNQSVWFRHSGDHGTTFFPAANVSDGVSLFLASDQQISGDPEGEIDVVWTGLLAENTVLLAHSDDHGKTFSTPKIVSLPPQPNNTGAGNPAIGEDACGNISVAWSDDSAGAFSGDFDIYMDRTGDDGFTFSNTLNLSNTTTDTEVIAQMIVDAHDDVSNVLWTTAAFPSNVYFSRIPASFARPRDFAVEVIPNELTAAQGATPKLVVAPITLQAQSESVALSCSNLPPFATCSFNPASVVTQIVPQRSTMTLTVPATLSAGTYLFGVDGVSASTTDTQTVELIVTAPSGAMTAGSAQAAAARNARATGMPQATTMALPLRQPLGEGTQAVCRGGDGGLCGVLHPSWPHPRWPRARACRGKQKAEAGLQ